MENKGEIVIFESEDGLAKINVNLKDENVWLSLDQMAILFDRDKSTISRHITNVFEDNELIKDSVVANFATTEKDGKVSHEEAMKKVEKEYKKYQVENLSEIEKEYLKSIQFIEKKAKKQ